MFLDIANVHHILVSKARTDWSKKSQHEDLQNICSHLSAIDTACSDATSSWGDSLQANRERIKSMRAKEDALDSLKKRRDKLRNELANSQKNGKQVPPNLTAELNMVESQVMQEDAEYEGFKRAALKTCFHESYDAYLSLAKRVHHVFADMLRQ